MFWFVGNYSEPSVVFLLLFLFLGRAWSGSLFSNNVLIDSSWSFVCARSKDQTLGGALGVLESNFQRKLATFDDWFYFFSGRSFFQFFMGLTTPTPYTRNIAKVFLLAVEMQWNGRRAAQKYGLCVSQPCAHEEALLGLHKTRVNSEGMTGLGLPLADQEAQNKINN